MYKLCKPIIEGFPMSSIIRIGDKALIPLDEGNKDYQEYLKWVAEGNEPLPADE